MKLSIQQNSIESVFRRNIAFILKSNIVSFFNTNVASVLKTEIVSIFKTKIILVLGTEIVSIFSAQNHVYFDVSYNRVVLISENEIVITI